MNNILEKLVKEKNYSFNYLIFNLVKEYDLSLEEFILLIYFLNQDNPSLDVEKIKAVTKLEINKILESFTSLSTKGLVSIKILNQNNIPRFSFREAAGKRIKISKGDFEKEFNSVKDCAEWFVENQICKTKNVESARAGLKTARSAKGNGLYYGYLIENI